MGKEKSVIDVTIDVALEEYEVISTRALEWTRSQVPEGLPGSGEFDRLVERNTDHLVKLYCQEKHIEAMFKYAAMIPRGDEGS